MISVNFNEKGRRGIGPCNVDHLFKTSVLMYRIQTKSYDIYCRPKNIFTRSKIIFPHRNKENSSRVSIT